MSWKHPESRRSWRGMVRAYGLAVLMAAVWFLAAPAPLWAQPASPPEGGEASAAPSEPSASTSSEEPAAPSNGLVTVTSVEAPIERVLQDVSRKSGKTIVARGKTSGQRVTLLARNDPVERALDKLVNSKPNWLWYKPEDRADTYEVWDQESFRAEVLPRNVRQKVFVPREITAEEAFKAIQPVLTPNIGSASFDPRSNKVIVTDLPYVLELIQRLLDQIDVKFVTRVFYIQHADINSIAEKLSNLKSPAAPAPEVDERTRYIIVRDRLEIIRQMDLLVETLDVGPEMRVYDLNNIGLDGENLADMEEAVTEIVTPDAFFRINAQSGRMLVQDVPEVHEKIEKILAAFDSPPKQVRLELEILEALMREGFNWQVDYAFSEDLMSAAADGLLASAGIPRSTRTGADLTENLGFLDFRKEFPAGSGGSTGLNVVNLNENAFFMLKTAMSDSRTRILQQPRAIVKNQQEAVFSVGERIPYFTGGGSYTDVNGRVISNASTVSFVQAGLDVTIIPTISNNGMIEMDVEINNNRAAIVNRLFDGRENEVPEVANQEILTTLLVPSGETRVIGGLIRDNKAHSRSGIPGLIKIPVVGPALFGKYDKPETDNFRASLLVFITPTIVIENPTDLLKYKGRLIASEKDADTLAEYPPPAPTVSDMQIEPLPTLYPPTSDELVPPTKQDFERAMSPAEPPAPVESEPAAETEPDIVPLTEPTLEEATEGLTDLRAIRIEDRVDTGPLGRIPPRLVGPSGALTGGATPAGQQPGQPAGQPAPGGPPQPAAPTPGPTPPPQAPPQAQPPAVQNTPAPPQTPPPTETRSR